MSEEQGSSPLIIKNIEQELLLIQKQKATSIDEALRIKMMYSKEIEKEYTKTKAPELSNQTKRNVAVEDLLEVDERYQELSTEIEVLEIDSKTMAIDLHYEQRKFQVEMKYGDLSPGYLGDITHQLKRIADALEKK
ncbi:MAG: hypothetical protein ACT6FE_00005 [Methanosarcinaceae archaeon]